jgi:hypothetical protein
MEFQILTVIENFLYLFKKKKQFRMCIITQKLNIQFSCFQNFDEATPNLVSAMVYRRNMGQLFSTSYTMYFTVASPLKFRSV